MGHGQRRTRSGVKNFWTFLTIIALVGLFVLFANHRIEQSNVSVEVRMVEEQNTIRELNLEHQNRIESAQWWHDLNRNVVLAIKAIALSVGFGLSVAASVGGLSFAGMMVAKWQRSITDHRAQDGLWGIKVIQTGPWWKRLVGQGETTIINLNNVVPGVSMLTTEGGLPKLTVAANGFSDEQQLAAHERQQKIQMVQAAKGRTPAQHKPNKWEVLERNGLLPEPKRYALPVPEETPEVEPQLPLLPGPIDALRASKPDGFIIGQADNGRLLPLNLRSAVHVAILGNTGCGKTASTGFQLAMAAMNAYYRLVILDGKQGMDWTAFDDVAERHDTDRYSFLPQMQAIHAEYERRMQIAQQYQAKHISEVSDKGEFPPILVIVEEFGDLMRLTPRNEAAKIESMLDSLGAKGRAAGIHFALIDQYPETWSQVVLGATKAKILYQLGDGGKVHDYHVVNLPDYGRFRYKKQEYNAWHVEPELPRLITATKRAQSKGTLQRYPMLIEGDYSVIDRGTGSGSGGSAWDSPGSPVQERNGVTQMTHGSDRGVGGDPKTPVDTPSGGSVGQWVSLTEDQVTVIEYTRNNPNSSIRECASDTGIPRETVRRWRNEFVDLIESKGKVH